MAQNKENIDLLLQRCKAGDRTAQLQIYNRYYRAMYNISVRIVQDPAEAEDIMQESFLSAFTKLDSFKGEVTFGAWLKRIVINNSIQHYRQQQQQQNVPLDGLLYKVESEAEPNHDKGVQQQAKKVLETMKSLKENYRISLTLHLIEGYDYEEISAIMGISYANCRTVISRAKESLRKKLLIDA